MSDLTIQEKASNPDFITLVDSLIMNTDIDQELADGIAWIDSKAKEENLSFYEMAYLIVEKHMAIRKAKAWLALRTK